MRSRRHTESTQLLLQFLAGRQPYLAGLDTIGQVERLHRVEPLPGAPPWVDGLLPPPHGPLPLLCLATLLGESPPPPQARARILLVDAGGRRVALRTDSGSRIVTVPQHAIEPPPLESGELDWVRGVATFREQVVMIIDPRRVVSQDHLHTLDRLAGSAT